MNEFASKSSSRKAPSVPPPTRPILLAGLRATLILFLFPAAALLSIAIAIGARLPRDHTATVSGLVQAPPARVWGLLTDIAAQPTWRGTPITISRVPFDPATRDCWYEPWVLVRFPLCATNLGETYRVLHTARSTMPFTATWTFELTPVPGNDTQTTLTITESSVIGSPLLRFLGRYIVRRQTAAADYLAHLQAEALPHP